MGLTITFPSENIQGNPSDKSYWQAVHHPVVWTAQRKDFDVISIEQYLSSTIYSMVTLETSDMAEAVAGDYVYLQAGDLSFEGIFQIVDITGDTFRILHYMTTLISGGYINYNSARKNYYLEAAIYSLSNTFSLNQIGTMTSHPNAAGLAKVNIMEYLKTLIDFKETFNFDSILFQDETLGGKYTCGFYENYNTTRISYGSVDYLGDHNFVNASKQVGDKYGANMGDYVPSLTYPYAKFMSDFEKPTLFSGFPFALTFIMSEKISAIFNSEYFGIDNLTRRTIYYDASGVIIGSDEDYDADIYVSTNTEGVYRLMINSDTVDNVIPSNATIARVCIFYSNESSSFNQLTEFKTIKINQECQYKSPVFIDWLGTNGGRNFWLFDTSQSDVLEVTSGGEFSHQEIDLENDLGNGEYLSKGATPELVCTAYLEVADLQGLKGLMKSIDVLMLTNPETWTTDSEDSPPAPLPKWNRVKVLPQTYKVLETNQTHASVEITLLLPTLNIQTQ